MATYRWRGKRCLVEIRRKGNYQSRTFPSKTAARLWAERIETEIDEGRPTVDRYTLRKALERYRDEVSQTKRGHKWERDRINLFIRTMPFVDQRMSSVSADDLCAWIQSREVGPGSKRRELTLLSSVYTTARRVWRWISYNPVADVPKPPKPPARHQTISPEQIQAVYDAAGYLRGREVRTTSQLACAAFDLALETAMRAGEILSLRAGTMRLNERYVILPKTKNGERREVPLSRGAVQILQSLDPERPFPITSENLSSVFRKLVAKAGMKGEFTFHDSRAEATRRLSDKFTIYELARITGHRNLSNLLIYYRKSAADMAKQLD